MSAPLKYLARSAWTNLEPGFQRVKPDRKVNPAEVTGAVLHWPGAARRSYKGLSEAQVATQIRSFHRYHTETRNWADIGYPKIADLDGRIWEGAGDEYAAAHSASPGYPRANHENMAILLMLGTDDEPSEAMVAAVNWQLDAWAEKFPNMRHLRGHGQVRGASTECPGPAALRAIADGTFRFGSVSKSVKPAKEAPVSATYSSPVEVGARLTSAFGQRNGTLHAGADYGPPKPGQTGSPIFAVADGTVVATGRGDGSANARIPYHSGRFVLIDHGMHGGDRMRSYYGHLARIDVKPGERVVAGQQIGIMGGSGARGDSDFAIHLHLGVSQNHEAPIRAARKFGDPGWIDPHVWLRSKGITPGVTAPARPRAASGGSKTPGGTKTKPKAPKAVKAAPKPAEWPGAALLVDGVRGPVTIRAWQRLLAGINRYKGKIDGDWGPVSKLALQRWLKGLGYYNGKLDGIEGPMTLRGLQRFLAHRKHYEGAIDGVRGPVTIRAEQSYLNSQRRYFR